MKLQDSYLPILSAQIQCINEQLDGVKNERLSLIPTAVDYRIEKIAREIERPQPAAILFQGQGDACHVFLNGYQSFFFTE
ncbi:hypothetical protein [Vibrio marisflavi]|uniref:Uncharacterized protein n=1 Tax=Vibrio marisflavi CECT 7928 TaxID=634439 RepID=A0ABM9A494_9VIBR|nr:hypothetical protein [Vibrio marisflavi]CAH0539620.1 hypothetical protein VMF7928_02295 [Vibrio marisflavi CECT 7928]